MERKLNALLGEALHQEHKLRYDKLWLSKPSFVIHAKNPSLKMAASVFLERHRLLFVEFLHTSTIFGVHMWPSSRKPHN